MKFPIRTKILSFSFLLLCFLSFAFPHKITLNRVGESIQLQLDVSVQRLRLYFQTDNKEPRNITLSKNGEVVFTHHLQVGGEEELILVSQRLESGIYSLETFPPAINKVRVEYRQSSFNFILQQLKLGNQRLTVSVVVWFFALFSCVAIIMFFDWIVIKLLLFSTLTILTIAVTPHTMGNDETYHLPGFAQSLLPKDIQEIRAEFRDFLIENNHLVLQNANKNSLDVADSPWCPHSLAHSYIRAQNCTQSDSKIFQFVGHFVGSFGWITSLSGVSFLGRLMNWVFIGLTSIIMAFVIGRGQVPTILATSFFHVGFVGALNGVTDDVFIGLSSVVGAVGVIISMNSTRWVWLKLAGTIFLTYGLLQLVESENYKKWAVFAPIIFLFILYFPRIIFRLRFYEIGFIAILAVLPIYYLDYLFTIFNDTVYMATFEENHSSMSGNIWHLVLVVLQELGGTLIQGKVAMPDLPLSLAILLYIWIFFRVIRIRPNENLKPFHFASILVVMMTPVVLFGFGWIFGSYNWVTIRYLFPLMPFYLYFFSISFNPRQAIIIAATIQLIAFNCIYVYAYWFRGVT